MGDEGGEQGWQLEQIKMGISPNVQQRGFVPSWEGTTSTPVFYIYINIFKNIYKTQFQVLVGEREFLGVSGRAEGAVPVGSSSCPASRSLLGQHRHP